MIDKNKLAKLRQEAYEKLKITPNSSSDLLQEFSIYQAELEAQNQELLETQERNKDISFRFEQIFFESPVAYLILNEKDEIIQANKEAYNILKLPTHLPLPLRILSYLHTTQNHKDFLEWIIDKDAPDLDMRLHNDPLLCIRMRKNKIDNNNCLLCLIDITREKNNIATLNKEVEDINILLDEKQRLLLQQSKLAALGEMMGAIAHQWRQPLNALDINLQNLDDDFEEGLIDEKFIDAFVIKNRKIVSFMNQTIENFRSFFGVAETSKSFSVKDATQEIIEILHAQLRNNFIEVEIDGEDFELPGIKSQFQQIILNIINNSKDAIVSNNIKNGKITVMLSPPAITLQDNGGGIDPSVLPKLFEAYVSTKSEKEGSGIGLYLCKMIVEKSLGGKIGITNVDNGALTTIDFSSRNANATK